MAQPGLITRTLRKGLRIARSSSDAAKTASDRSALDPAEQLLIDNVTGLLNMHTAKNPYGFGPDEIAKVKQHRASTKLVAETLVHRIEREGPSIDALRTLANVKNDLAEYNTAQLLIEQMLDIARSQQQMTQSSIAFMMTDKCNLRCKHCFIFNEAVFKPVPRKKELSSAEYVEIFRSLKRTDQDFYVHITGGGEVFARQDFEEIMKNLAVLRTGYPVSMQTNGHFPERLRAMLEDDDIRNFLVGIQFSLDGLEATHNGIRGNGNFAKLVESIKISREFGLETSTITTILKENIESLGEIKEFAASLGIKNHRFQLFFEGAEIGLADISKATEFITERDRSLVYHDRTSPGHGCLAGIRTCVVRPDGSIETCRESYSGNVPRMVLTDLREHGLDLPKALTSIEAYEAMRGVKKCIGCACFCAR
jgi:MoaA/NifB/PqqE/SkfB family radical SAM enzyme